MNYKNTIFILTVMVLIVFFPVTVTCILAVHLYLYICSPYSRFGIFKSPYTTYVNKNGIIDYRQEYALKVYSGFWADWLGYYRSALLIVANTLFGGFRSKATSRRAIIADIHRQRFDPSKPYLISGDQFSVLYPRNLGVFYNQILDRQSSLSKTDFTNRQRLYLQSVLVAIDGLSTSSKPRTTIVPIGPRHAVLAQVHPGGVGSDQVYGLLYAISELQKCPETKVAVDKILLERSSQLKHIVHTYLATVRDSETGFVKSDLHLASARDGVVRQSSFYDNIVLWKTQQLANQLGLVRNDNSRQLATAIRMRYWNAKEGYYNDDLVTPYFSSDVLLGYVTGFFDVTNKQDLARTKRMIAHIESSGLAKPFPIKYQVPGLQPAPLFVRLLAPSYGSNTIWSYWGAQYITLLINMYNQTSDKYYLDLAGTYLLSYDQKIVEDGGFAETFDESGAFMKYGIYKSIRITGWIVQYEHARHIYDKAKKHPAPRP
jgi:hypothetical protein